MARIIVERNITGNGNTIMICTEICNRRVVIEYCVANYIFIIYCCVVKSTVSCYCTAITGVAVEYSITSYIYCQERTNAIRIIKC